MKKSYLLVFGMIFLTCSSLIAMDTSDSQKNFSEGDNTPNASPKITRLKRAQSVAVTKSEVAAVVVALTYAGFIRRVRSPNPLERVRAQTDTPFDGKIPVNNTRSTTSGRNKRFARAQSLRFPAHNINANKQQLISADEK